MAQNNFDTTKIDIGSALYLLKLLYGKALKITDCAAGLDKLVRYDSPLLNHYYISTYFLIGELLKKDGLETLENCKGFLFRSLAGNDELDIEWQEMRSGGYDCLSQIEMRWIGEGRPSFELPADLKEVFANIDMAIAEFQIKSDKQNKVFVGAVKEANKKSLVEKDGRGDFFYDGKRIEMDKDSMHYKVFDILFSHHDQHGFLSYEDIEKYLAERGVDEAPSAEQRNKRVQNVLINQLFRFAKVNKKPFSNGTLDGKELIEVRKGKGLVLNNNPI